MTNEQYIKEWNELLERQYAEKHELASRYALEHSPCGIGDIIEDSVGRIIVEKIKVEFSQYDGARRMPTCIYYGTELRKADNRPKSKGEKRGITQSRLLKIVVKAEDSRKEENNGNVM